MKPLITALVDTYNHERYIEQALVSVVEQGLSPSELEIIVVDDGSTDGTPSIIQKFLPRVQNLRKKNGGQASAYNAGFSESQGQIVALLDGDDWWAKGKLRAVVETLEQNPDISAASHAYHQFYEETNELKLCGLPEPTFLNLATQEAVQLSLRNWVLLQPSALTVRRKLLERIMPISEMLVFSADFPIAAASLAMGVRVLAEPLSYYRFHAGNLYAVRSADSAKMHRRYEMDDMMYKVAWPMLLGMGVPAEIVSALFATGRTEVKRSRLRTLGGSRWETLATEMQAFRYQTPTPTVGYRLFKYLAVGTATLLLAPRTFYRMRAWYGERDLGRIREGILKAEVNPHNNSR